MRWLLLVALVACINDRAASPAPQVVNDPKLAQAVNDVVDGPVEPVPEKARTAAIESRAPILGEWTIRTLQSTIDGKASEPSPPIVPGSWVLGRDGSFKKLGGNEVEGTYVYTGTRLVVTALGPALEYEVAKLTPTEMVLIQRIEGTEIANTTTFDRKR